MNHRHHARGINDLRLHPVQDQAYLTSSQSAPTTLLARTDSAVVDDIITEGEVNLQAPVVDEGKLSSPRDAVEEVLTGVRAYLRLQTISMVHACHVPRQTYRRRGSSTGCGRR